MKDLEKMYIDEVKTAEYQQWSKERKLKVDTYKSDLEHKMKNWDQFV